MAANVSSLGISPKSNINMLMKQLSQSLQLDLFVHVVTVTVYLIRKSSTHELLFT